MYILHLALIITLGDRRTCVCEQLAQSRYWAAQRSGVKFATSRVSSQRLNNCTTVPHCTISMLKWNLQFLMNFMKMHHMYLFFQHARHITINIKWRSNWLLIQSDYRGAAYITCYTKQLHAEKYIVQKAEMLTVDWFCTREAFSQWCYSGQTLSDLLDCITC